MGEHKANMEKHAGVRFITMQINENSAQSFGPNRFRVVLLVIIALVGYGISTDLDPARASIPAWAVGAVKIAVVAMPIAMLCWLLSVRLMCDQVGLRCSSLLGEREMRWDEVDELYAGVVVTLLHGVIPVCIRYSFKLKAGVDAEQRVERVRYVGRSKLTYTRVKGGTHARVILFGSRFHQPHKIAALLAEYTSPHVWSKVSQRFKDGLDVSFGAFVLSSQGVKFDLFGMFTDVNNRPIPWDDVRSYSVDDGKFTLVYGKRTDGKTYSAKRNVSDIANFRVMMALLNQVKPLS